MHTDCEQCGQDIAITGDGSHAFATEREGGPSYFCNEVCKRAWLDHPQRQLREVVVGLAQDAIPFTGYDQLAMIVAVSK